MFKDNSLPNDEIIKQELEKQIVQFFDELDYEENDPEFSEGLSNQKKIALEAAKAAETDDEMLLEEARKARSEYGRLLAEADDRHKESEECELIRARVGVSNARLYYESGDVSSPIDILDGTRENGYLDGYYEQLRNLAVTDDKYKIPCIKMKALINLLIKLEKLNSQTQV